MKKQKSVAKKKTNFMDNLVTKEVKVVEKVNLVPPCFGTFEAEVCIEIFCKNYPECRGKV
jgi:hypothetical protein